MPAFEVITYEKFSSLRFRRSKDFNFASTDALCPIDAGEVIRAALHVPIAFTETESGFDLVAVQGIAPMQNLLVDTGGQWLVPFLPACYRAYPFLLVSTEQNQEVLCFDVASGLLVQEQIQDCESFFEVDGTPAKGVQDVLALLSQISVSRRATHALGLILNKLKLIQEWPICINFDNEQKRNVEGLFRIDESRLNDLPDDDFLELRRSGALPLIYCQLMSMQNFDNLLRLSVTRHNHLQPALTSVGLDLYSDSGTLNFDNL